MTNETGNPGPSWDLLFRVINFITLVGLLVYFLKKPVKEFFQKRSDTLKSAVDEARKMHQVALTQSRDMEARIQNLEKENQDMLRTFREEAASERSQILKNARSYTERLKEDVKKIAESEVKKAKVELREVAIDLSKEAAQKILKQELKGEDEVRLTRSYLDQLKRLH